MEQNKTPEILAQVAGIDVSLSNNTWCIQKDTKQILLLGYDDMVHALPLLLAPNIEILSTIKFPVDTLIKTALTSGSEYWVTKTLPHMTSYFSRNFKNELLNIIQDKSFSQEIRHKVKRKLYQNSQQ